MLRFFRSRHSAARGGFSTYRGQRFFRPRFEALETRNLLSATVINVDTFDDVVNAADGVTSLREAVIAANASAGDEEIQLAAGTYALAIPGNNDDIAATGDLDILNNGSVKIIGAGAGSTTIDATGLFTSIFGDRVIDVLGANLELTDLTLTGGSTRTTPGTSPDEDGGAVRITGGQVTIVGSSLVSNTANGGGRGGGIYNAGGGELSVIASTISGNTAASGGGAGIYNGGGELTISGSNVSGNSTASNGNGGGIYNSNGPLSITDSTLSGNTANSSGGAIFSSAGSFVTIIRGMLTGNSAADGGAIYRNAGGSMSIIDTTLSGNTAGIGGAIYNVHAGSVSINGSTLAENSAGYGGGVYNVSGGQVTITDGTISGNTATAEGGGIHNRGAASRFELIRTTVSDSSADYGAGVYNANGGTTKIVASTLSDNTANSDGGGVYNSGTGSSIEIVDGTLVANSAGYGGGIFNASSGHTSITDSTLSDNSANFGGGGIFNSGSGQVTLAGSTVSGNTANSDGGGAFNATGGVLTLTNTTLSRNSANSFGGGIYNVYTGSQVSIRHSTITGNHADVDRNGFGAGGGMFLVDGTTAVLDHTIVAGNLRLVPTAVSQTASDIERDTGALIDATSAYNLMGDPATAGGFVHGANGNIVGDGLGHALSIVKILDTNLADNGGPTLMHALVVGSPAINAGDPSFNPNAFSPPLLDDQRGPGFPRVREDRIDIGAYEAAANPTPVDGIIVPDYFEDSLAADGLWSLRKAVIYANSHAGDEEIQLAAGTYALTIQGASEDAAATGDLDILNHGSLKIIGAGAAATTIDAFPPEPFDKNGDRIFDVKAGAVVEFAGLMLTGGGTPIQGGAIRNIGGQVTITASTIANNLGIFGGGIYNDSGGQITIVNSALLNNRAGFGGGIYNTVNSQVTMVGSMVSENIIDDFFEAPGAGIHNAGAMTLIACTVSANVTEESFGGGIYSLSSGTLTINDSTISNNTARGGGGVWADSQVTISDSLVSGNTGGGITTTANAVITNTVVTNNIVYGIRTTGNAMIVHAVASNNLGRGIVNIGNLTIADSAISDNFSESDGAGIFNQTGHVTIIRTSLSNNSAVRAGAIYNTSGGTVTLSSSTLSGNSASRDGGGIYNASSGGQVKVEHSTITGNRAGADGNATSRGGGVYVLGNVALDHTIVAGNVRGVAPGGTPSDIENGTVDAASAYNLVGDPLTAGGLVHGTNGNIVGDGSGNLLPVGMILDPMLAGNGGPTLTHALVGGGPAVNAGDPLFDPNATNPPVLFDQRGAGFDRLTDGRIDIGAFEFGSEFQNVIVGRHIFYNNSKFDGNTPEITVGDGNAIATNKSPLASGLATFANVTSYSRGINGIMIDIAGSHPNITDDDFIFRVGNSNSVASWAAAPEPAAISVLAGQGVGGADRVEIVWADGQIKNKYLQVILAASGPTGLADADEFFWGNRVGDSGTSTPATLFQTTSTDAAQVHATITGSAAIDNLRDYDRSGDVTSTDAAIVNANIGTLVRIAVVVPPPAPMVALALAIGADVVPQPDNSGTDVRLQGPVATVNLIQERLRVEMPLSYFIDRGNEIRTSATRTTAERWIDIYGSAGGESAADGLL
jgi:hypothetical protein